VFSLYVAITCLERLNGLAVEAENSSRYLSRIGYDGWDHFGGVSDNRFLFYLINSQMRPFI